MRAASMGFVLLPLMAGQIALAQTTQPQTAPAQTAPAVEDFKPASSRPRACGCPSGAESL